MCEDDGDVDEDDEDDDEDEEDDDEEDNDYSMRSSGQVCWEVS